MNETRTGQLTTNAAKIYDEFFVPALFAEWAPRLLAAVNVERGSRVLDVACGTGVVARHARHAFDAQVVGLDLNLGMLATARAIAPDIGWVRGVAELLPFADDSFDSVVCQFGLMFFTDPVAALGEMLRVLRPGGQVGVAVWASLEQNPGYDAVTRMLQDLFGDAAADAVRAPFLLGDVDLLRELFAEAGATNVEVQSKRGTASFESLEAWMHTDIHGWTLSEMIDDDQFELLLEHARQRLARFVTRQGTVRFDSRAHIVVAS